MSELLSEHPDLSQEQVQEAVAHAKGNRKVVAEDEYQAYAKAKLSAKNLEEEMKQANGSGSA